MRKGPEITTNRLLLRRWRDSDLEPFAALNSDPTAMEFMPSVLTVEETAAFIERIEQEFEEHGYGLWAVEHGASRQFIGFAGLARPRFVAHFTPAVEIGWRLSPAHWGSGYATEAARAAFDFGFSTAGLTEIVSFAVPANQRSLDVMRRLGMTHDPADDFDHPNLPEGSPLRRHILYRMSSQRWSEVGT